MLKKLSKAVVTDFLFRNLLLLFFIYDFIVKILVHYSAISSFYNYVIVFKAIIIIIVLTPKKHRHIDSSYLYSIIGLTLSFIITKLFLFNKIELLDFLFNGYYFLSSILPLCFVFLISKIEYSILRKQLFGIILFLLVSSVFVLVGLLFEIEIFRTYFRSFRYGFSGLLLYHHEVGFIYFILLNLLYYRYKKKSTVLNLSLLIFILMMSLVIGTKKTLFLTTLFFVFLTIDNLRKLKTLLIITFSGIIGTIVFSEVLKKYFVFFYKIYEENGFLNSLLSYRNKLLTENLYPYVSENFNIKDVLFGWPLFKNYRSEMEFFDLFLFFGIIGVISYFLFFKKILIGKSKQTNFMIFALLIATIFSGNLFISVNVMVMMYLATLYMNPAKNFKSDY